MGKTTGSNPVPDGKMAKGYRYEEDKFNIAGLHKLTSTTVVPPRIAECPVQLEAVVEAVHGLAEGDINQRGRIVTFELRIQKVHLEESILMDGQPDRVDPDKWRPLIMSFQQFYGLGEQLHSSTLAEIPEHLYNSPDRERAMAVII